jgi:hypothetical protein
MKFEQHMSGKMIRTCLIDRTPILTNEQKINENIMKGSEKIRHSLIDKLAAYKVEAIPYGNNEPKQAEKTKATIKQKGTIKRLITARL